jgi:ABC-2 type transport system permease protein
MSTLIAEKPIQRQGKVDWRWFTVAGQEIRELWLGGRGLTILLTYSLLLSLLTFISAGNADLNLLDARETVSLVVKVAIGFGTLAALITSADAIAGERERGTLEHLLLTPVKRRDLIAGKLLAAFTVWLAALAIAVPYVLVLARGPGVAGDGLLLMTVVGTLIALTLTSFGMIVSIASGSNKMSLVIAIVVLIALAAPSQLPSSSLRGIFGDILVSANPMSAGLKFSGRVLVDSVTWSSEWKLLVSPAIGAVVMTASAIGISRYLRLGGIR